VRVTNSTFSATTAPSYESFSKLSDLSMSWFNKPVTNEIIATAWERGKHRLQLATWQITGGKLMRKLRKTVFVQKT